MTKKAPDKPSFWFPSLLASSNNLETNSWFNILETKNNKIKKVILEDTNYKVNYLKKQLKYQFILIIFNKKKYKNGLKILLKHII